VREGEVTLSGTVSDRQMKRAAEDVAEAVFGVEHVQNNIRVKKERNDQTDGRSMAAGTGRSQMQTPAGKSRA
jgi:hypothetical protein